MEIVNQTPFPFVPLAGRIGFPGHSLTLIVKATFDLALDQAAVVSDEQLFPTGDELYPDDDEGTGSSRYESDFAYYKPGADLLLAGTCHAPGGEPVQALKVTFQAGNRSKTVGVFGNRYWRRIIRTMSDPEPFTKMELRYENSYGGPGYIKNPTGKGYGKIKNQAGKTIRPLPNIEHLNDLVNSPGKETDPAGFGPLGSMWGRRSTQLGTYKGNWFEERWPWYPKDFDWGYFNAAPPDMQMEGYLTGDESLYFENLHPRHSQYQSKLPGIRVRLFLNIPDPAGAGEIRFSEVPLRLDTLWADMDAEKLVLVWRGVTEVQSEDYEEIGHVFIVSEKLDETARPLQHYQDLFLKQIADPESEEDLPETPEPAPEPVVVQDEVAAAEAEIRAALIEAGIDPDEELPEPSEEDKAMEARLIKEMGLEDQLPEPPPTRESLSGRAAGGETFTGLDLRGMDLSNLDFHDVDFTDALLSEVNFRNTNLSHANFSGATLSMADLSDAILKEAVFKDADLTNAVICNADLTGAMLEDAIFDNTDLRESKMDHCTIRNVSFSNANMTNTSLRQCQCYAADFSHCLLSKADFQGADLTEACVEDAHGVGVNMTGANLTGLRASGETNFSQGIFRKVTAPYSIWEDAILDGADFSHAFMEGVNFASASLKSAIFISADLRFSRFLKSNLFQVNGVGMNLFQASLERADLTEADFRGTNFYGAEFLNTVTEKTRFEQANLKMTKLS